MTTPTPTTVQVKIQLRRDTAATWASVNPVLLAGEAGLETDTNKIKIGNGSTAWNSLGYFPFVVNGGTVTGNLEIGTTGTLTFEGSSADNFETTLGVINPTADRTINLPNVSGTIITTGDTGTITSTMIADGTIVDADVAANAEIAVSKLADGAARQLLQTDAAGTGVEWTSNVDIPGTLDVTGAATFDGAVTVAGDLTVNGTTTTISTQNLLVEDKNIIIGDVATPSDTTADGGGITLKGATDKTINWVDSTDAWTSSERFSVPLGSAAAPSLTFTGDENTGIYSPGADQVAISTGGSGRLFVDASGRLGVGTSSPSDTLQINKTGAGGVKVVSTAQSTIYFSNAAGTGGYIIGRSIGSDNAHNLFSYDVTNSHYVDYFEGGSSGYRSFYTNGAERLRITSAGLVGIGSSSPLNPLVVSNGGANGFEVSPATNSGTTSYLLSYNRSTSAYTDMRLDASAFRFEVSATERMRLTSTGLGIGTTSPATNLHVVGGGPGVDAEARISSNQNAALLSFTPAGTNGIRHYTIGSAVGGSLIFYDNTASTQRAAIDSSGRLLVGTSSARSNFYNSVATSQFQVEGTSFENASASLTCNNSDGTQTSVLVFGKSNGTGVGSNTLVTNNTYLGAVSFMGNDGTEFVKGAEIRAEVDGTPGANDMPGRLTFSTTADGASSPTERMRIDSAGLLSLSAADTATNKRRAVFTHGNSDPSFSLGFTNGSGTGTGTEQGRLDFTYSGTSIGRIGFWRGGGADIDRITVIANTNGVYISKDAVSWTSASDERLKTDLVPIEDGLSKLENVRAFTGRYLTDEIGTSRSFLIAQDFESVLPEAVNNSNPDELGLSYTDVIPLLVSALKESKKRIETLEAKVAALETP